MITVDKNKRRLRRGKRLREQEHSYHKRRRE
jgi:hypothetical protein